MNENSATVVNQNFFLLIKAFFTYSAKSRLTDSVLANLGKSVCSFVLHKWIRTQTHCHRHGGGGEVSVKIWTCLSLKQMFVTVVSVFAKINKHILNK